jgi:lipopolysaccharide transport system permease protein
MTNVSAETGRGLPPSAPVADRAERARRAGVTASRWGLVWTLVRTDFKARYHGALSGFVWALLKPLAMFVVLMSVFSILFAQEPAYELNLIAGLFLWDFFAEGTKTGITSLAAKAYLLSKARFPSWILVVTSISNAVITLTAFSLIILVFLIAAGRPPSMGTYALYLCYCIGLATVVVGFSLATSVLFLRYRDLNQVWDVVVQAGFFVAPIVYPLGIIPERYHFYLYLWPPTAFIEFSRSVLVAGVVPTMRGHLLLALGSVACLLVGALIYRRLGPRAAEYL